MDSQNAKKLSPVDMHVHVVGRGLSGTGCRLNLRGWRHLLARLMVQQAGLRSDVLKGDLDRIFADKLIELLSSSSVGYAVVLAQDHVHTDKGEPMPEKGLFYVPNDYVFALARRNERLLPAVSIHPGRRDALDELERCLAQGAVMMKCLPNCQNINCSDRRYTRFWEKMAQAGLPLLAHTGGEYTIPVVNAAYATPEILRLPLECGVKVIAAHAGTRTGLIDPDYFPEFERMLERYPNLYGDSSALTLPFRSRRVADCLRAPVCERMVHGSDFPVPSVGIWSRLRGLISSEDHRRIRKIQNPIERDFQLKVAMGFGPEHFTRIWDILRKHP